MAWLLMALEQECRVLQKTEQRIRLVLIYFPKPPSTYSIHSFIQYYYLLHTYRLLAPQGSAWQTRVSPSSADARVKTGPSFVYESNCSNNFYWLLNESFFQYTKSKFCIDFFARQKSSFTRFDESKLLFQGIVTSQYIHTYYTYCNNLSSFSQIYVCEDLQLKCEER